MITGYENKWLRLNYPLRNLPKGTKVNIVVDKDGIPKDKYWRDRIKDAKTDGCVEFIEIKSKKSHKKEVKNG